MIEYFWLFVKESLFERIRNISDSMNSMDQTVICTNQILVI